MCTWHMFIDTGNSYRWEISDQIESGKQLHCEPIQQPSSVNRLPSIADLLNQECSKLMEIGGEHVESLPMFRTGLGKSVVLKQFSISKALSILGDEPDSTAHTFTGQSCGRDNKGSSMFQTGSGKAVNISSAGLVRAKTLLGFEDKNFKDHETFHGLKQKRKQSDASQSFCFQNQSHLEMTEVVTNTGENDDTSVSISPFTFKSALLGSGSKDTPDYLNSAPRPPPFKFHTAGGRSISVSSDALQCARSLLGDPELGTLLNEANPGNPSNPVFSIFRDRKSIDSPLNKQNDQNTYFSPQETVNAQNMPKTFISPIRSNPAKCNLQSGLIIQVQGVT